MSYSATQSRDRVVELAKISVAMSRDDLGGQRAGLKRIDHSSYLVPQCVLALEGDGEALGAAVEGLTRLAAAQFGVNEPGGNCRLNDSFSIRSIVEAYHAMIDAGLIDADVQDAVAAWLYDFALAATDGRVMNHPDFAQWHLRNQNVPSTCVYDIAHLLEATRPGAFDTGPLWRWADEQIVGWDLTWRGPDDSYLYQFIWTWSAYLHARLRRPDLLDSANARRGCAFYATFQPPGRAVDLVFGDAKPGDLLGPMTSVLLGSALHHDGALLSAALRILDEAERRGACENLIDRGPELYRLYTLWPDDVAPTARPQRAPALVTSPLPGRGWSFASHIYDVDIKGTDERFPFRGQNDCCWDAMYQVQDPAAYAQEKPDKIIFARGDHEPFAIADLRCHGLHDHCDALGVVTLIDRGLPWLVESTYQPRETMRLRWYHNVPLFRPGTHKVDALKHWRSDTWREVAPGDVWLRQQGDVTIASALQRGDGYDYVPFTEGLFDVQRTWVYDPSGRLIVLDQLTATRDAEATVGQIWHTTADAARDGDAVRLARGGMTYHATFAQSFPATWSIGTHESIQNDPFYFPEDKPVTDLLRGATVTVAAGDVLAMAACFARETAPLTLDRHGARRELRGDHWSLASNGLRDVTFETQA